MLDMGLKKFVNLPKCDKIKEDFTIGFINEHRFIDDHFPGFFTLV